MLLGLVGMLHQIEHDPSDPSFSVHVSVYPSLTTPVRFLGPSHETATVCSYTSNKYILEFKTYGVLEAYTKRSKKRP